MSVYSGPNTTQDSLILHIDPSNPRSYPGTGATIFDLSGNNNDGIFTSGVSVIENRRIKVLNFTTNDSLIYNLSLSITSFPLSILVWINQSVLSGGIGRWVSLGNESYVIRQQAVSLVHSYFYNTNNSLRQLYSGSNNVIANEWALYASTHDGNRLRIYKNNSQIASSVFNEPTRSGSGYNIGSNWGETFTGNMGEIRVYSRALTHQEIINNFNATRGRYGI